MAKKQNHWVSQRDDGNWAHKKEGNSKASGIYNTQKEAWDAAKNSARKDNSEAILKGRDGKIREKNSYGNDPHPPKG